MSEKNFINVQSQSAAKKQKTDVTVIMVYQNASKKNTPGTGPNSQFLQKLLKSKTFTAAAGELQFARFAGKNGESLLFIGLGAPDGAEPEKLRKIGAQLVLKMKQEKCFTASLDVDHWFSQTSKKEAQVELAEAFCQGFALCQYDFKKYQNQKKGTKTSPKKELRLLTSNTSRTKQLKDLAQSALFVSEAVSVTRDWSNEPSNYGTPSFYASETKHWAKKLGLRVKVLGKKEAEKEKMGLFLGVARGAGREPKVVIVEYAPKNAKKTVALVGKGVTFDSGGISLKPGLRMEEMKHDMTGAATVMGAVVLAARWKSKNRVIGIMGFTENMPDAHAIQPGNVLTGRNGKTVEILNTDAEGRLVLADILDYVQDYRPDVVVDIATLTGAVGIALGNKCCALFGNRQEIVEKIRSAGARHGERLWQLPLYKEYLEDMKSETADLRNAVNDSYGGTIRAAIFLQQFIRKGMKWAHIDIASTARAMGHLPYYPSTGASGAYVRTLAQFATGF